jgi:hypothetical protein
VVANSLRARLATHIFMDFASLADFLAIPDGHARCAHTGARRFYGRSSLLWNGKVAHRA